MKNHSATPEQLCEISMSLCNCVDRSKIVDWERNVEVERQVRMEMEDYLFDVVKGDYGILLSVEELDEIVTQFWNLAIENREL